MPRNDKEVAAIRQQEKDIRISSITSAAFHQRDEGREEFRAQVRESLQNLDAWEDAGRPQPDRSKRSRPFKS